MDDSDSHRRPAAVQRGRFARLRSSPKKLQDKVRELPLPAGERRAGQLAGVAAPATPSPAFSPFPGFLLGGYDSRSTPLLLLAPSYCCDHARAPRCPRRRAGSPLALAETEKSRRNTCRNDVATAGNDSDGDNDAHDGSEAWPAGGSRRPWPAPSRTHPSGTLEIRDLEFDPEVSYAGAP
ncbi:hypothetical protein DL764_002795 [Monosporascus ibericus]|uniref:Uncharacterized protein n=1 Tax=Monosporascus ibericus TaxID=155417 RepID=A0A4Q4TJ41_9PEZI|nr:hypothetical protein DL764_002795 [Monosporascus ibericus]